MFLVDTNVISELSKSKPSKGVLEWFSDHSGLCLSVLSIQELTYGIELAPHKKQSFLQSWMAEILDEKTFTIVGFDFESAKIAGMLMAKNQSSGQMVSILDVQIAASALRFQLTLATRNQKDFLPMAIPLVDPFSYSFA